MSAASVSPQVVFFTGFPSSGKSTLAGRVAARLRARGVPTIVLDGDEVRASLRPSPGYDDTGRADFYETLARLAALLAAQRYVVLVAATANRRAYRALARALAPAFVEVFVDTPLDECRERDAKGLYRLARSHGTTGLPGVDVAYEPPEHADFVVHPGDEGAVDALVARICIQ